MGDLEAKLERLEADNRQVYGWLAKYWDRYVQMPDREASYLFYAKALGIQQPHEITLLDAGCGIGEHAIHLARKGFSVSMCDINQNMVTRAEANAKAARLGIEAKIASWHNLEAAYGTEQFDVVIQTMSSVALNLSEEKLRQNFQSIRDVLKASGKYAFDIRNLAAYKFREDSEIFPVFENKWFKVDAALIKRGEAKERERSLVGIAAHHKPTGKEGIQVVRAWNIYDLRQMLRETGFDHTAIYFNFDYRFPQWPDTYPRRLGFNAPAYAKSIQIIAARGTG